ncbi:MAG TPA: uroporphyrinogen-III synthase [Rhodospirillales bacterium]|nr:uroporphyrinogen-III synthase [Rhodospirillales bacterium]
MRVMITRPRLEAVSLADTLEALSVESLIEPLLHIEFIDGPAPDLSGVQALLVTSANGVRAFVFSVGEAPPGSRPPPRSAGAPRGLNGPVGNVYSLPVYTVGDASARAARGLGFTSVTSASGDVESLAGLVGERLSPDDGALLHIAATSVAGDLAGLLDAKGFLYRRERLYRARKAETFSDAALAAFRDGGLDGILFFSPRTAKTFVTLAKMARLQEAVGRLDAYCLSDAVAHEAEALVWRAVHIAARPEQSALLDLFKRNRGLPKI